MNIEKTQECCEHQKENHSHAYSATMSFPVAAKDFLKRFFIVSAILVPLAIFSKPAIKCFDTFITAKKRNY